VELKRGLLGPLKTNPGGGEGGDKGLPGLTGSPPRPRGDSGGGDSGGGEEGAEPEAPGKLSLIRLKTSLMSWEELVRPPLPAPCPLPLPLEAIARGAGAAAWRFLELRGAGLALQGKETVPGSKPTASSLAGLDNILGPGALRRATEDGRGGGGEYLGAELTTMPLVVEKSPKSPAHWFSLTGSSTAAGGQPARGVSLISRKASETTALRASLLQAKARLREVRKCSLESQG
jgi:hypothetical protein